MTAAFFDEPLVAQARNARSQIQASRGPPRALSGLSVKTDHDGWPAKRFLEARRNDPHDPGVPPLAGGPDEGAGFAARFDLIEGLVGRPQLRANGARC